MGDEEVGLIGGLDAVLDEVIQVNLSGRRDQHEKSFGRDGMSENLDQSRFLSWIGYVETCDHQIRLSRIDMDRVRKAREKAQSTRK
jgi:hypothetical protein